MALRNVPFFLSSSTLLVSFRPLLLSFVVPFPRFSGLLLFPYSPAFLSLYLNPAAEPWESVLRTSIRFLRILKCSGAATS